MNTPPIKVGFDFDGVIVYNPVRIIRPIVTAMKRRGILFKRRELEFFKPKNKVEEYFWRMLHQSSIYPADGLDEIRRLVREGKIEAFIVTGRFKHLEGDFLKWMHKIKAEETFTKWYMNKQNEEPHKFKERMIKKLDLDIFIEDNWDIVNYLSETFGKESRNRKRKIFWIYNILDRHIPYLHKFPHLSYTVTHLGKNSTSRLARKILVVSDFFYPHWTGLSKSVFHYLSSFSTESEITVLTVRTDPALVPEETVNNIHIIRSRPSFTFSRAKYSLSLLQKSISHIRKTDAVFINSPCTNILPISLLAKLFGKKLVIFHQGDLILPKSITNKMLEKVFEVMTMTSFSLADKVSTYTRDYAAHSRVLKPSMGKCRETLLPLAITPQTPQKTLQHKKVTAQTNIVFGFAGRFVEEKGFDILFQAIPNIIQEFPKAQFHFAGKLNMGYEDFFKKNEALYKKVKKYIVLKGLLSDTELKNFYTSLDFFILPSRSECLGLVQMESILYGTPVIVSDIPGARMIVKQTKFGTVFETENPQDLAQKVIHSVRHYDNIMKNRERAQSMLEYKKLINASKKLLQF